jgi:hypothetical protein
VEIIKEGLIGVISIQEEVKIEILAFKVLTIRNLQECFQRLAYQSKEIL